MAPDAPSVRLPPARVLLVDDVPDNRELVRLYLKGQPVTVVEAGDGREAVEHFVPGAFDAVILDMMLPVMDGVAVLRCFRGLEADRRVPPVPVLAISAGAFPEDEARSLAAGCCRYLAKPVSRARLLSTLAEILGGSVPAPGSADATRTAPPPPAAPSLPLADTGIRVTVAAELAPLIPRLLENITDLAGRALRAAGAGEGEEARRHGHAIKGAALWYGFALVSALGADLERRAASGDLPGAKTAAGDILALLPRLRVVYTEE